VARALSALGWDGALHPGNGDYLLVVDANVGYNKASARVHESIAYQVDLRSAPPLATLTLVYTHTSTATVDCVPEARYDPVYEQMMARCYWDYVRVYLPADAGLVAATAAPIPGEWLWSGEAEAGEVVVTAAEEGQWLVLGQMGVLPPASTQRRVFTWTLGAAAVQLTGEERCYSLRVQKQAGTAEITCLPCFMASTVCLTWLGPSVKIATASIFLSRTSSSRLLYDLVH
jgi:hypothetical protein